MHQCHKADKTYGMLVDIETLKARLTPGMRLLGLDPGTKTIGIARSDSLLQIATPVEIIRRTKFSKDIIRLKEIIAEEDIGGLIIGLPINMDGSEGPRCQSTRQFTTNLLEHIELPVCFWDERLSPAAVTRTLLEADSSRKRRKEVVDKMAAAYILQGALDRLSLI